MRIECERKSYVRPVSPATILFYELPNNMLSCSFEIDRKELQRGNRSLHYFNKRFNAKKTRQFLTPLMQWFSNHKESTTTKNPKDFIKLIIYMTEILLNILFINYSFVFNIALRSSKKISLNFILYQRFRSTYKIFFCIVEIIFIIHNF